MTSPQPGWYADPAASHELRWWDGATWTDAVMTAAVQTTSPLPAPGTAGSATTSSATAGSTTAGSTTASSTGPLFTAPVLVVSRACEAVELSVLDEAGRRLGTAVEVGQRERRGVGRLLAGVDRLRALRLEVRDAVGVPQLLLTRPPGLVASRVVVERPGAGEVGQLVQDSGPGAVRCALRSGGRPVGSLDAQDRRGGDVRVLDVSGVEVARIRRLPAGARHPLGAHVVHVHRPLPDPLASLVVASALTVGAPGQDPRGTGTGGQ